MTNALFHQNELIQLESAESTEWVRGNEAQLLDRLSPLVRRQNVLLDFRHVLRIDAAGLAALISLYRDADNAGHRFAITNPASHVHDILAVVGLDRILLAGEGESRPGLQPDLVRTAA